jgi:hypothetical protein
MEQMEQQTFITHLRVAIAKSLKTTRRKTEAIQDIVARNADGILDELKVMMYEGFIGVHPQYEDWQLLDRGLYLVWLSEHPKFEETLDLATNRLGKVDLSFLAELLFGTATRKLQ